MDIFLGIILLFALLIFFFYGSIAVRHTLRFRYIGHRTIFVSLAFVGTGGLLVFLSLATYITLLFN